MTITPTPVPRLFKIGNDFAIRIGMQPSEHEFPHFCYIHFRHGVFLYVGISKDWQKRTRQHAKQSPWFYAVDHMILVACADEPAAHKVETQFVRDYEPLFNKDLFGGFLPTDIFRQRLAKLYANLDNPSEWQVENPCVRPAHKG